MLHKYESTYNEPMGIDGVVVNKTDDRVPTLSQTALHTLDYDRAVSDHSLLVIMKNGNNKKTAVIILTP